MTRAGSPVAVLQFPGSNCVEETVRALRAVGLPAAVYRWNDPSGRLADAPAAVLPGGFAFQDRVRAGALAAKLSVLSEIAAMAADGRPVLGICNGAQVLVETGLIPGLHVETVDMALAANRMPGRSGYYTRWVHLTLREESKRCVFTKRLKPGTLLSVPVAHGEGRFESRDRSVVEALRDQIPLVYSLPDGTPAEVFPWNPNGSFAGAAAVMNREGNVLGMMPHPERALRLRNVPPGLPGPWGEARRTSADAGGPGPGWGIFLSLAEFLEEEGR